MITPTNNKVMTGHDFDDVMVNSWLWVEGLNIFDVIL